MAKKISDLVRLEAQKRRLDEKIRRAREIEAKKALLSDLIGRLAPELLDLPRENLETLVMRLKEIGQLAVEKVDSGASVSSGVHS